jgi:hypothetical protein
MYADLMKVSPRLYVSEFETPPKMQVEPDGRNHEEYGTWMIFVPKPKSMVPGSLRMEQSISYTPLPSSTAVGKNWIMALNKLGGSWDKVAPQSGNIGCS